MKPIKQIVRKSLKFLLLLVASFLSTQSMQAAVPSGLPQMPNYFQPNFISPNTPPPPSPWSAFDCSQAWQELQGKIASLLNGNYSLEDVVNAQAEIVNCQLALARKAAKSDEYIQYGIATIADCLNVETSNPLSLLECSLDLGDFENVLLNARAASVTPDIFLDNNSSWLRSGNLFCDVVDQSIALEEDLLDADRSNPEVMDQLKGEEKNYELALKNLHKKLRHYQKLELQDAVKAAALTPEEQQLWGQFQSALTEKYKKACKDYLALVPSTEGVTDPKELQNILLMQEIMEGRVAVYKLLEQGCLYEFLNVLLTKRNDTDSSLNSFHQLQEKLTQFLNNGDVIDLLALFQVQVNMLAYRYEKEGATAATPTAK